MRSFNASSSRDEFLLDDNAIYLDGNSLGPLSKSVKARLNGVISNDWQKGLVESWSQADWIGLSEKVGKKIAPLIGAPANSVMVADTVSINIFKLAAAALAMRPDRTELLTEAGSFPTDAYMLDGLAKMTGKSVRRVKRQDLAAAINDNTALVLATHVHYVTADLINVAALTSAARQKGALCLVDLSHTVGALPIDLNDAQVDFAVGCGYKYLNGGPGAPGFAFVAPEHQDRLEQPLTGWMGHRAPFNFDEAYTPATGVNRLKCGTPPILSLAALDAALDLFSDIDMNNLWAASQSLSETFVSIILNADLPGISLASPNDPTKRGSHVSFAHENGYAIVQALIARGITGDFRQPHFARFGFAPLYLRKEECAKAAEALIDIVTSSAFTAPEYQILKSVT